MLRELRYAKPKAADLARTVAREKKTLSARVEKLIDEVRTRTGKADAAMRDLAGRLTESLFAGLTDKVLIDRCVPGQRNAYVGRSYADAPEIDGVVYVTGEGLAPGRIVPPARWPRT